MPYIILAVVAVVFIFGSQWYRKHGGKKEKVVDARVLSKQALPHQARGKDDDSMPTDYVVTFQYEQKTLSLVVNHSFYDKADTGMQGKLTFKGDVFIDFEVDDPRKPRL